MVEHDAKSSPVPRCGHTRGELRAINEGVRAVKTTRDYLGWSGASTPDAAAAGPTPRAELDKSGELELCQGCGG